MTPTRGVTTCMTRRLWRRSAPEAHDGCSDTPCGCHVGAMLTPCLLIFGYILASAIPVGAMLIVLWNGYHVRNFEGLSRIYWRICSKAFMRMTRS